MGMSTARVLDETIELVSVWDIGSNGAHTKTAGVPGTGFASVARTAAGKYTITFSGAHQPFGPLVDLQVTPWQAANEETITARPTVSSYSPSAGTVAYESWEIDETAAQVDWPSGSKVTIRAVFLKTIGS